MLYKGHNITQVLALTVEDAHTFFAAVPGENDDYDYALTAIPAEGWLFEAAARDRRLDREIQRGCR